MTSEEYSYEAPQQSSVALPLLIVLVALIFSYTKDSIFLYQHRQAVMAENGRNLEVLKQTGKQAQFVSSLQEDLGKLAQTDPAAAQIFSEFFAPSGSEKK